MGTTAGRLRTACLALVAWLALSNPLAVADLAHLLQRRGSAGG
jgi:hypothetical protein